MLSTLKATLTPSGVISFDDPVRITGPVRVLVTMLEELPSLEPSPAIAHPGPEEASESPIDGEDPARAELWQKLIALREHAIAEGMHLMDWDEVNAEVRWSDGHGHG